MLEILDLGQRNSTSHRQYGHQLDQGLYLLQISWDGAATVRFDMRRDAPGWNLGALSVPTGARGMSRQSPLLHLAVKRGSTATVRLWCPGEQGDVDAECTGSLAVYPIPAYRL